MEILLLNSYIISIRINVRIARNIDNYHITISYQNRHLYFIIYSMNITPELQQEMDIVTAIREKKVDQIKQSVHNDKKLTLKQKLFICNYIDNGGNASDAVRKAGYNIGGKGWKDIENTTNSTVWTIAVKNMQNGAIVKYLDDFGELAGSKIVHIMNNWREDNQLKASTYVYDQVHWKASQKIEQTVTFSLSGLSTAIQEDYKEINIVDTEIIDNPTLHNIDYAKLEWESDDDLYS